MAKYKKKLHVLKFVLETKTSGLTFLPLNEKIWELEGISDANFTTEKETHISVMGYFISVLGIALALQNPGQKAIVISTTEVEYVGIIRIHDFIKNS